MVNLLDVFDYNHYFVMVMNIINESRLNPPKEGHKHHIVPKSWYKLNKVAVDNSKDNVILLSYDNHLKIHKLYTLCIKGEDMKSKMKCAFKRLGGFIINSEFEGEKNPFYGKHHSSEVRTKLHNRFYGKPRNVVNGVSKESRESISNNISNRNKLNNVGRKWFNNGIVNKFCFECPDGFVEGMVFKPRRRIN